MEQQEIPLVQFTTNSFTGNPYVVIALGFISGMTLMFFGIMLGVPVFISMLLLLGGIGIAFGYGIGKVTYQLTHGGVVQKIRRFIPYALKHKEETRTLAWSNITSYKNDIEKKRYSGEYEYLKLYLNISPGEIWVTNQQDDRGFQQFKAAFMEKIGAINSQRQNTGSNPFQTAAQNPNNPASYEKYAAENFPSLQAVPSLNIKERKSFYETFFAKLLTIFFILVTLLLIWIFSYKGMHLNNWFKLMFIVLPGTVYMIYRVYFPQDKNKDTTQPYQK